MSRKGTSLLRPPWIDCVPLRDPLVSRLHATLPKGSHSPDQIGRVIVPPRSSICRPSPQTYFPSSFSFCMPPDCAVSATWGMKRRTSSIITFTHLLGKMQMIASFVRKRPGKRDDPDTRINLLLAISCFKRCCCLSGWAVEYVTEKRQRQTVIATSNLRELA